MALNQEFMAGLKRTKFVAPLKVDKPWWQSGAAKFAFGMTGAAPLLTSIAATKIFGAKGKETPAVELEHENVHAMVWDLRKRNYSNNQIQRMVDIYAKAYGLPPFSVQEYFEWAEKPVE